MSKVKKSRKPLSSGRRWKQWKEPEARAALTSWRDSGLSAAAFCAREGYSETRLRYWSERLGETSRRRPSSVSFVPNALGEIRRANQIEIERAGVVLRIREDLDVAHGARGPARSSPRRRGAAVLTLPPGANVFLATGRVDGRKGINGLSTLARAQFGQDPLFGRKPLTDDLGAQSRLSV